MSEYVCRFCREQNPTWLANCPQCGEQGALVKKGYVGAAYEPKKTVQTLNDVEVFSGERINTGIPSLNKVFGRNRNAPGARYGIHVPSVTIIAGGHGGGKTTLLLKMLALTSEKKKLLISTEQPLSEIKSSLVGIGLEKYASQIPAYSLLDDQCNVNIALEKVQAFNPKLLVVDSSTKMLDPSFKFGDKIARQVHVVQALIKDARENKRATILVSHMTKAEQISGASEQLHDVSTVMMLVKCDQNLRMVHCPEKNRFGPTSVRAYFVMGATGMEETEDPQEEQKTREDWGLPPKPKPDKLAG